MKKTIWLISIIALLLTMLILADTYGLFETNASADSELTIGKWKIKVNDVDISLVQSITLNDFTYSASQHTADGYFAPGRSAQFEIEIDASECEVSVEYDFVIDDSQIEDYPNIYFTIEDVDTGNTIVSSSYSGTILLSDVSRVKTLRVNLNWVNNPLYDESDTSTIGKTLSFIIDADFKQYLGSS